jgi:hypothetical protein
MQGEGYTDVNSFLQLRRNFLTGMVLSAAHPACGAMGRA